MGWVTSIAVLLVILMIIADIVNGKKEKEKIALMSSDEKKKYREEKRSRLAEANQIVEYGAINTEMMCPHCQTKGKIRTKHINHKKGVSGGKATAAVLTGGLSLIAVGLSRKEEATQAHCDNCNNTWLF